MSLRLLSATCGTTADQLFTASSVSAHSRSLPVAVCTCAGLALLWDPGHASSQVFLDGSSSLLLNDSQPILSAVTSLAFRTCGHGTILRQTLGNDSISLAVLPNGALELSWSVRGVQDAVMVGTNVSNNRLHWLSLRPVYGMVWLHADERRLLLVASDTIRPYLLSLMAQAVSTVVAPSGFRGCLSEGANLPLASARSEGSPQWGTCPLPDTYHCKDYLVDPCFDYPCWHGGLCMVQDGVPTCTCTARYIGKHCELDKGKPLALSAHVFLVCVILPLTLALVIWGTTLRFCGKCF
ncbi:hypothetical protein V5799_014088 [Amblyomma americanum]|uniref:EGF-like domain-containing protein n=1 Tax=Amblyomma americanum TaxID=6943 RepID=A0AAQ4E422_AMBAM